jgi:L-lactate dehydrogenase (cytochrome)
LIEQCKEYNFETMAVTVDSAVGGNRERDLYTGFTIPMSLSLKSIISFATHPAWAFNYFTKPKWELSNLNKHVTEGTNLMTSIGDYFTKMLDNSLSWEKIEQINKKWGKSFAIKGIMSVDDAKKAVDVGASAIMISNHGGRQLDGSRSPFDQLEEIVNAVGDKIDVICEGGIRRGTHILKALSLGAKACSGGRMYLYALAAGGQKGVEIALNNLKKEIERDMILMGVSNIQELSKKNLRFRV